MREAIYRLAHQILGLKRLQITYKVNIGNERRKRHAQKGSKGKRDLADSQI